MYYNIKDIEDIADKMHTGAKLRDLIDPSVSIIPFIIHPWMQSLRKAMPFMKDYYRQILQEFYQYSDSNNIKQGLPISIKRFHYFMDELTPIGFGGGAIAEWLAIVMMNLYDIPFSHWTLEVWAKAVTTPEQDFVKHYEDFFEVTKK